MQRNLVYGFQWNMSFNLVVPVPVVMRMILMPLRI